MSVVQDTELCRNHRGTPLFVRILQLHYYLKFPGKAPPQQLFKLSCAFSYPHLFSALFHYCSNFSEPLLLATLFFSQHSYYLIPFLFWQRWMLTFPFLYHKSHQTCLLPIINMKLPNTFSIVGWLISLITTVVASDTYKNTRKRANNKKLHQ